MSNLPNLDADSIRLFVSLTETLNLSKTAQNLSVSVSTASRMLGKLRSALSDELFVRYPHGMRPTPAAQALETPMRNLLEQMRVIFEGSQVRFHPRTLDRMFRVGAVDQAIFIYLHRLPAELLQAAPGAGIDFLPIEADYTTALKNGQLDVAIYPNVEKMDGIHSMPLARDVFVYAVAPDHPLASRAVNPAGSPLRESELACYRRIGVSVATSQRSSATPDFSATRGDIPYHASVTAVWTPYFMLFPALLAHTDLIGLVPMQLASRFREMGVPLVVLGRPANSPIFSPALCWHDRVDRDPAVQWLRGMILSSLPETIDPELVPVVMDDAASGENSLPQH